MDRRHGQAAQRHGHTARGPDPALLSPALLLLALAAGGLAPAHASLLIDWDASRALFRNDGDPAIVGRRGGESRPLGQDPLLADPLAAGGVLRFPPCRALPAGRRGDCPATGDPSQPAGPADLQLAVPLDPELGEAYLAIWESTPPPPPPERQELDEAVRTLVRELAGTIHHRELAQLLAVVERAIDRAEAAEVDAAVLARARRGARMTAVLGDLWRLRNTLSSRDLSLPCDALERRARQFNAVAGAPAVRLQRQRPPGICLFCGNVCTVRSADRLLADMKASLLGALGEWSEQEETREGLRRSP